MHQGRIKELLHYDPDTGEFTWKIRRRGCAGRVYPGAPAGNIKSDGYCMIRVGEYGKLFAHHIAYFYMTGRWPPETMDMDHINGDRADNRWGNLRVCSRSENMANSEARASNTSGFKGVFKHFGPRNIRVRWKAQIGIAGKLHYLGLFNTPEEAHHAYTTAAQKHFGDFARTS